MSDPQGKTEKIWKAVFVGGDQWAVIAQWYDERGRRCTQIIADVHEQASEAGSAEANAKRIVEAVNGT